MPNGEQNYLFREQYIRFLDRVRHGLSVGLAHRDIEERGVQDAANRMLASVFEPLSNEDNIDAVVHATRFLSLEGRTALTDELGYLATYWTEAGFKPKEAKTAKDSLEKLLGRRLPRRIRDLLHILNEILSIVNGRGNQEGPGA